MSAAKDFLRKKLNEIFVSVDGIEITYEFREATGTHIVEVKPTEVFKSSEVYLEMEMQLEDNFTSSFPDEELLFISEDSLTEIRRPEFKLVSKLKYRLERRKILQSGQVRRTNQLFHKITNYALAA